MNDESQTTAPVGGDDFSPPDRIKIDGFDLVRVAYAPGERHTYEARLTSAEAAALARPAADGRGDAGVVVPVAWRVRYGETTSWSYMEIDPGPSGGYWTEVVPLYAAAPPPPAPVGLRGLRVVVKPLDGPGTEFVEIEDAHGRSVKLPWVDRLDGLFEIHIGPPAPEGLVDAVLAEDREISEAMRQAGYKAFGATCYQMSGERQRGWGEHAADIYNAMERARRAALDGASRNGEG